MAQAKTQCGLLPTWQGQPWTAVKALDSRSGWLIQCAEHSTCSHIEDVAEKARQVIGMARLLTLCDAVARYN